MSREPDDRAAWLSWIEEAAAALEIDAATLDVDAVLGLAGKVAHRVARPMAPVTAYLVGVAVGAGIDPNEALERINALLREARSAADQASSF